MMDSQRSHCQQIISSTVCCTCIPVTKWCHWYTGELSRCVRLPGSAWRRCCRAQPGGTQGQSVSQPILARVHLVKLERVVWATPSLLIGSCHFLMAFASPEACWSLLCRTSGGCAFLGCPRPQQPGVGSLPVPSPPAHLLLIASLNNRGNMSSLIRKLRLGKKSII